MTTRDEMTRRRLLGLLAAAPVAGVAAAAVPAQAQTPAAAPAARGPVKLGLVSRHVQWTTVEDAIDIAAEAGFDSIEWNVRTGGHIDPAHVARDLPRVVEQTRKAGLAVEMITTSIQDARSPHAEAIVETAGGLGIRYYRGGQYFRFDYAGDLWQQLQALKPRVAGLAALNEKHGTLVAYHTHSAPGTIGGNIWDFWEVIREFDPRYVGLNYDIGHATARGGTGWIDAAHVVRRHIAAIAVKDVRWEHTAKGWRTEFHPVGEGMIDLPRLFALLAASNFSGPVNLHYEHNDLLGSDVGKWTLSMPRDRFMALVAADLRQVRTHLRAAGL